MCELNAMYQTVELENGTWDVFSLITGERVAVVNTKAEAVDLVCTMNRAHDQALAAFNRMLGAGA